MEFNGIGNPIWLKSTVPFEALWFKIQFRGGLLNNTLKRFVAKKIPFEYLIFDQAQNYIFFGIVPFR